MTNSNAFGFYPDRSKYNLEDNLALKSHTHGGSDLDLAFGEAPGALWLNSSGGFACGELPTANGGLYNLWDGVYYDDDPEAQVSTVKIKTLLHNLHLPEGGMRTIQNDNYNGSAGSGYHSTVYYWLKGGYLYWIYIGNPDWTANTTEVKTLGYFKYDDGTPCPIVHAHGQLQPHQIDPSRCNAFLCHPTSSTGLAAPWKSYIAMHKKTWDRPPSGSTFTGCGVFLITGEHYKNTGTAANPVWELDRSAWYTGV